MTIQSSVVRVVTPLDQWRGNSSGDESQMLLPLAQAFSDLTGSESREWVVSTHADELKKARRKVRRKRAQIQRGDNQLALPLFEAYPELENKDKADWLEAQEWLEEEWVFLHGALLERSLEDLTIPTAGAALIEDITTWLCEPIVQGGLVPRPFSLQACAELFGLDAEALQLMALRSLEGFENHRGAIDAVRDHISVATKRHDSM